MLAPPLELVEVQAADASPLLRATRRWAALERVPDQSFVIVWLLRHVELHAIQQSVIADRAGVCGAATEGIGVTLAGLRSLLVIEEKGEQLDVGS